MLTTTSVIKSLIQEDLELAGAWNQRILNLTALAKILKPKVESKLELSVELSSLVVSLNRLSKNWQAPNNIPSIKIKNIQITKNITTLVYTRNPRVILELMKIKDQILESPNIFLTHEIDRQNILFSTETEYLVEFKDDLSLIQMYQKSRTDRLLAVNFELESYFENIDEKHDKSNSQNFIHYAVLHKLAEANIPVIRMRSCQNQFLFLIESQYLDLIYKLWRE